MSKLLLAILLFVLPFSSNAADSAAKKPESGLCSKQAVDYAKLIANVQYPEANKEIKAPFNLDSSREVTETYLLETGKNKKQIAEMQKMNPVQVYAVDLKSADKWDCSYYVTMSIPVESVDRSGQETCRFSAITAHHCAK